MEEPLAQSGTGPPDDVISMVLMADPVSLSVVRERFRRWLMTLLWPPQEIEDVVMAVNEAVTSAVEQTHPSVIGAEVRVAARLFAESDGYRRVLIAVGADENWAPTPDDFQGPGLMLIHACMDSVEITQEHDGTTMLMKSTKVPPPI